MVNTLRARKRAKGFTLIEMMIVVAIIAILVAYLLPQLKHPQSNAQAATSQANMKTIANAIELYYQDTQNYPASGNVAPALFGGANNSYLQQSPTSPGPGAGAYVYATDGTGDYTITDPSTYDAASLTKLNKGTAPSGGTESLAGGTCGTTCTHLGFSNIAGNFGY